MTLTNAIYAGEVGHVGHHHTLTPFPITPRSLHLHLHLHLHLPHLPPPPGNFALLKFFGPFEFNLASRKLEFDFYDLAVLGVKFSLGRGGAADIGAATGLGSSNNKQLVSA